MALGNTYISSLGQKEIEINSILTRSDYHAGGFPDILSTFNFVVNYLGEWSDGTAIGASTVENLQQLNLAFSKLVECTTSLDLELQRFIERQKQINNGV